MIVAPAELPRRPICRCRKTTGIPKPTRSDAGAADPISFLRLAGIAFTGRDAAGRTLNLLRVEFEEATDVGSVTPHLGGGTLAYAPLPAKMVSRRRRLAFVYQAGDAVERLTLANARALSPA